MNSLVFILNLLILDGDNNLHFLHAFDWYVVVKCNLFAVSTVFTTPLQQNVLTDTSLAFVA